MGKGHLSLISFRSFVFWDYGVILELHIEDSADLYLASEDRPGC